MVKGIIEEHSGTIHVESEPEKGTMLTIRSADPDSSITPANVAFTEYQSRIRFGDHDRQIIAAPIALLAVAVRDRTFLRVGSFSPERVIAKPSIFLIPNLVFLQINTEGLIGDPHECEWHMLCDGTGVNQGICFVEEPA